MANIGAGETFKAFLIKKTVANEFLNGTSQAKDLVPQLQKIKLDGVFPFSYRHLSQSEMTFQPISSWLKGKFDKVLFTSETDIKFGERDFVLFEDGTQLRITRTIPQTQHGMFLVNKKPPHILELE